MSYQERRSIIDIVSVLVTNSIYGVVLYSQYIVKRPELLDSLKFWGVVILILIPVSIVSRIITEIIHAIYHGIMTGEEAPVENDERDKLIDLKSSRIAQVTFSIGFMAAMALIAMGQSLTVMFITMLITGVLSEIVDNIAKYIFYTRGV